MGNEEYSEIGKIIFHKDKVFYCSKCDKRYDYAILYDAFPDQPSCKICNNNMEIKNSRHRITILHPKLGGW